MPSHTAIPRTGLRLRRSLAFATILVFAVPLCAVELHQKTVAAFDRYARLTEAHLDDTTKNGPFLYIDALPPAQRDDSYARLRRGEILMEKTDTRDNGKEIDVPDGMVHHWIGLVFIPGATLTQLLAILQDYNHHDRYYKPDVVRARLLSHEGNDFRIYYQWYKHKVISVYLNTEHDARFYPLDAKRMYSRSHSTRIAEVEDAGKKSEREKPVGNDTGLLWRINSYWRYWEKDSGVYVQLETISLTRNIPFGVKWIVEPFVTSVPRESLQSTLDHTRSAVAKVRTTQTPNRSYQK